MATTACKDATMAGSDLFTGSLDLLILKSLTWRPMHGYAIARWIRHCTSEKLSIQEGALYPALHRLERRKFLDEEWALTDMNREAKFYRLTGDGRSHLRAETTRWRTYSRVMTEALSASRPREAV